MTTNSRLLLALALAPGAMRAQDPVHWTIAAPAKAIAIGSSVSIRVRGVIAPGWHVYSLTQGSGGPVPSAVTIPTGQPFRASGQVTSTPPRASFDSNFSIMVEALEKEAVFTVPVSVGREARPGRNELRVNVRYQVCNARLCNPVRTERLTAIVSVRRPPAP